MDKARQLAALLRDTAQSASNAIAGNVAGPVDLIGMGLNKMGVPVGDSPVGGSNWMKQQGFMRDVEQGPARVIGETAGMLGPAMVTQFAPQIARGALGAMDNAMAPATASKEMGGVLNPFPSSNYYKQDLSEYTPNVFRETDIEGASRFSPKSLSQPQDLWFANQPEYALGQGANRGVLLEMDAKGLPGQLSLKKPNARQMYDSDYAEFMTKAVNPGELAENVRSVKISPDQQKGAFFTRVTNDLKSRGFVQETQADKSIVFRKP